MVTPNESGDVEALLEQQEPPTSASNSGEDVVEVHQESPVNSNADPVDVEAPKDQHAQTNLEDLEAPKDQKSPAVSTDPAVDVEESITGAKGDLKAPKEQHDSPPSSTEEVPPADTQDHKTPEKGARSSKAEEALESSTVGAVNNQLEAANDVEAPPTERTDVSTVNGSDQDSLEEQATQKQPPESPSGVRGVDSNKQPPNSPGTTVGDDSFESTEAVVAVEPGTSKRKRRRRKNFILCSIIVLLIVGVLLAILFGTGVVGGKSSAPSPSDASQGDNSPTPSGGDGSPPPPEEADDPNTPVDNDSAATDPPVETDPPSDDPLYNTLNTFSESGLDEPGSPQWKAYQFMKNEDPLTTAETDEAKLKQRYALITMYAALDGDIPWFATRDECNWPWVICGSQGSENATENVFRAEEWQVTEINIMQQSYSGTLPPEVGLLAPSLVHLVLTDNPQLHGTIPAEIGGLFSLDKLVVSNNAKLEGPIPSDLSLLAPSLVYLDISGNPELDGPIPEELYELVNLEKLYLHNNALTGTLSEGFVELQLLEAVYLGNNKLTGPIPVNLGSTQGIRPLRFLSLGHNDLTGGVPNGMLLNKAYYIDLSFNRLSGNLPADFGNLNRIRHLYLDHNQFDGSIPESYSSMGDDRMISMQLNDNQLTGGVPSNWVGEQLNTFTVQNNNLSEDIPNELCEVFVLNEKGELVELGADCEVCSCECDKCY